MVIFKKADIRWRRRPFIDDSFQIIWQIRKGLLTIFYTHLILLQGILNVFTLI